MVSAVVPKLYLSIPRRVTKSQDKNRDSFDIFLSHMRVHRSLHHWGKICGLIKTINKVSEPYFIMLLCTPLYDLRCTMHEKSMFIQNIINLTAFIYILKKTFYAS